MRNVSDGNNFLTQRNESDEMILDGMRGGLGKDPMLEQNDLVKLLSALIQFPTLFSFLEQDYADVLEELGYFSLDEFSVTAAGRDFLATNATG